MIATSYSARNDGLSWGLWLVLGVLVAGTAILAFDGLHYWHDVRFLFAATQFSLHDVLSGAFNPHQSWGAIDETSSAGFYVTKVLHLWLLSGVYALASPSGGGFELATLMSAVMMGVAAVGAGLLIGRICERKSMFWLGLAGFMLLPVAPYLAGKHVAEVTSVTFTVWGLWLLWRAIRDAERLSPPLAAAAVGFLLLALLARPDSVLGILGFFAGLLVYTEAPVRKGPSEPRPVRRRLLLGFESHRRLLQEGLALLIVLAAAYGTVMLMLGSGPTQLIGYLRDFVDAPNRPAAMSVLSILCFGGVVYALALAALWSPNRRLVRFFVVWLVVTWLPSIALTSAFMVEPRYLAQGLVPLAGLVALGLNAISLRVPAAHAPILALLGLAVALPVNSLTIRLMPYELDDPALLDAVAQIQALDPDAAILVPWAYTDFTFLYAVRPSLAIYSVHSPRGQNVPADLAGQWHERYRRWFDGRHLTEPAQVTDLMATRPVYYLGWHRYPPVELVERLAVRLRFYRLAGRLRALGLTDHLEASWVRDWNEVRLDSAGEAGQYELYRVVTADSPAPLTETIDPAREIVLPVATVDDNRGGLIAHDLTGDGNREIIVTRGGLVTAVTLDERVLWHRETDIQISVQSERNGLPGGQAPGVQAGDIDGDGRAEVLYLTRSGFLEVLDGGTGNLVARIELNVPDGAVRWEHLVLANLRGVGDRDLILQATNPRGYRMGRYVAAYSLEDLRTTEAAAPLWRRDDFMAMAHGGIRVADLDGDGRDEIISAEIARWDGQTAYALPVRGHIDAVTVADVRPDLPGLEVVALEEDGGNRVFLFNADGLIWESDYGNSEPQNVAVADFLPDRPGLELWCRSRYETYQKPFVFDSRGELVTAYELTDDAPSDWTISGVEVSHSIHWTGRERQLVAAKARHESGDVAVFDAVTGEFVARLDESADRLFVADLIGDWREEIVVLAGNVLRIYENSMANPRPRHESLWNRQYYRRQKQTWNYYST